MLSKRFVLRITLACIYNLLLISGPFAQTTPQKISGTVSDPQGERLVTAQVILQAGEEVRAFGFTENDGSYSLSFEAVAGETFQLDVRLLGYKTKSLTVQSFAKPIHITLQETSIELREVTVRDKAPPLIEKSDTLVYRADSYRDGTEDKVEDLLRKLPGVEVDDKGKISVQGKQIQKVLIEGDDVFGNNYQIGTKNISANLIDKVEAIDDYNDDPVLQNMIKSGETVLNLKLKEGKKQFAFGELDLRYGNQEFSDNQVNLFALRKKTKVFVIGHNNNVGENGLSVDDVMVMTGKVPSLADRASQSKGLLAEPVTQGPNAISESRYNFNESYSAATAILMEPVKRLKIRTLIHGVRDIQRRQNLEETLYYLAGDTLAVNNVDGWRANPRQFYLDSKAEYRLGLRSRIRANFRHQSSRQSFNSSLLSNTNDLNDQLFSEFASRPTISNWFVDFGHRVNDQIAVFAEVENNEFDQLQSVLYQSSRYDGFLPEDLDQTQLLQSAGQFNRSFSTALRLFYSRHEWRNQLTIGRKNFRSNNNTDLTYRDTQGEDFSLGTAYQNDLIYGIEEYFVQNELSRTIGKLNLEARLKIAKTNINASSELTNLNLNKSPWVWQPSLSLQFKASTRTKLSFRASQSQQLPSADLLLPGLFLEDHRTLRSGIDDLFLQTVRNIGLKYSYINTFDQMSFFITWDRTSIPNGERQDVLIGPLLDQIVVDLGSRSKTDALRMKFDKYLAKLKGQLSIQSSALQMNNDNIINTTVNRSQINIINTNVKYHTNFSKWFKPFLDVGYQFMNIRNVGAQEVENLSDNHQYHLGGGIFLSLSEKVSWKTKIQQYHWQLNGNYSQVSFLDSRFQVKLGAKDKVTVLLEGQNLLDEQQLATTSVNVFSERAIRYTLRPRTILLGIQYKL